MKRFFKSQAGRFALCMLALLIATGIAASAGSMLFLKADVTAQRVMTPGEAALEVIRSIDEKVTIYYVAEESQIDPWVDELVRRCAQESEYITYRKLTPAEAGMNAEYAQADYTLTSTGLRVDSDKRTALIPADELYEYTYNMMYYYLYGQQIPQSKSFVAEERLVNALLYVTRDDMPVIYQLTGHGETALENIVCLRLQLGNAEIKKLSIQGEIPEDADAVFICAPISDLSAEESEAVARYLEAGGRLMLMTDCTHGRMPNLHALMEHYGMQPKAGIVLDASSGYCFVQNQQVFVQCLQPDMAYHPITEGLLTIGVKPMMQMCGAIEKRETAREGLKVMELMVTSPGAYVKNPMTMTTTAQESQDPAGTFTLALAAEEGDARVAWFACSDMFNDFDIQMSGRVNIYLFDGITGWMLSETAEPVNIEGAQLLESGLKIPEGAGGMVYAAAFAPVLLAVLGWGILSFRRKK